MNLNDLSYNLIDPTTLIIYEKLQNALEFQSNSYQNPKINDLDEHIINELKKLNKNQKELNDTEIFDANLDSDNKVFKFNSSLVTLYNLHKFTKSLKTTSFQLNFLKISEKTFIEISYIDLSSIDMLFDFSKNHNIDDKILLSDSKKLSLNVDNVSNNNLKNCLNKIKIDENSQSSCLDFYLNCSELKSLLRVNVNNIDINYYNETIDTNFLEKTTNPSEIIRVISKKSTRNNENTRDEQRLVIYIDNKIYFKVNESIDIVDELISLKKQNKPNSAKSKRKKSVGSVDFCKKVLEQFNEEISEDTNDSFWLDWLVNLLVENVLLDENESYMSLANKVIQILYESNASNIFENLSPLIGNDLQLIEELKNNKQKILETYDKMVNKCDWLTPRNCFQTGSCQVLKQYKKNGVMNEFLEDKEKFQTSIERMQYEIKNKSAPVLTIKTSRTDFKDHIESTVLSKDTKVISRPGYKKINVPTLEKNRSTNKIEQIKIEHLDPLLKKVFENVKSLNLMQSTVFKSAYHTNENLLISAPTGAGKTNVALLTIAGTLKHYVDENLKIVDKDFKIIYISPMKALAAEMTENFSKKLKSLGVKVHELTGDMQMTRHEIESTQMLVTTPEKWDVITRKPSSGNLTNVSDLVRLLIIDEVHLLNTERGPVIEAIVARTLRQIESSQSMIRIVGLSATLPNYTDVGRFLRVKESIGLFHFDSQYRPVPLEQTFIGVEKSKNRNMNENLDQACFDEVVESLKRGYQVMVFVHARRLTFATGKMLRDKAQKNNALKLFSPENCREFTRAKNNIESKSSCNDLKELFTYGLAIHHAGMVRMDRNLVEKYFLEGHIRVLICTATLAWGVNLPAHTVIIRGTEVNVNGKITDVDILDVQQIFGRAGRPQFDDSGHGIIITHISKVDQYLKMMTNQIPIESCFHVNLTDHLNAEIVLGTVSNLQEAITWLSYTYFNVRVRLNPLAYGLTIQDIQDSTKLYTFKRKVIVEALKELDSAQLVRITDSGQFISTSYGQIASHYYIKHNTMELFTSRVLEDNSTLMTNKQIFELLCKADEFSQIKVREEEINELLELLHDQCEYYIENYDSSEGKVNILMQTYLSRGFVKESSLVADLYYIQQNIIRLSRALFEIFLRCNLAEMAGRVLTVYLMFNRRQWDFETPVRQFNTISFEVLNKIERNNIRRVDDVRDVKELARLIRNEHEAPKVMECLQMLPRFICNAVMRPITKSILQIIVNIKVDMLFNKKFHGLGTSFWLWIEDPIHDKIYHSERISLSLNVLLRNDWTTLYLTISLKEPIPAQYVIKIISDEWLGCSCYETLNFSQLKLADNLTIHTEMQQLMPLPVSILKNRQFEKLYNFNFFNPIQTQMFFALFHTDMNMLLGAPTGSGKTILAEIAMLRVFNKYPNKKVVYIAPLKALVRERYDDWVVRFGKKLNKIVVELTGDSLPGYKVLENASLIISTPEKWDVVSRTWEIRTYVKQVGLIVIDEIHLLGEERGPVLEALVSRFNYIASKYNQKIRMMGLSTAIANAYDVADWLGVPKRGIFNFRPSVRPVPLSIHITSVSGQHYCPRMKKMNKNVYQAIREHATNCPALVFVSSRRQTRLTAIDLMMYLMSEGDCKRWLHCSEEEIEFIVTNRIEHESLKDCLPFGIGLHHAGLTDSDRKQVEKLFLNHKIQVLVATATLAWGVNFPARLVVVKGTEYFDAKTRRYKDMPMTDILQMVGRAGRPQFDTQGIAVVITQDIKKEFYKRFLYEPFPIESHMLDAFPNHLNAEIAAGTVINRQQAHEYASWTFLYRRIKTNPSYYGVNHENDYGVQLFMKNLIDKTLDILVEHNCIVVSDYDELNSTVGGKIASQMYLSYQTIKLMIDTVKDDISLENLLRFLCGVYEYAEVPVRHNENLTNASIAENLPMPIENSMDSPYAKTFILIQSHLSRIDLLDYCSDYVTDLKSVLEQFGRIAQGVIDYACSKGWIRTCLLTMSILQMIAQAQWLDVSCFQQIPHLNKRHLSILIKEFNQFGKVTTFPQFILFAIENKVKFYEIIKRLPDLNELKLSEVMMSVQHFSLVQKKYSLKSFEPIETNFDLSLSFAKNYFVYEAQLKTNSTYVIQIDLSKLGISRRSNAKAFTPLYPKPRLETWVLFFYQVNTSTILMKRSIVLDRKNSVTLKLKTENLTGIYDYELYLISDVYLGLDQVDRFRFIVLNN